MKRKTEQQHLSKRLYDLIYNPDLPFKWDQWKPYDKLLMFHALFLTLNEDFQNKFGQLFDALIPVYLSNIRDPVFPEPHSLKKERLHAEKMISQYSSKIKKLPLSPYEICAFLFKEIMPPFISTINKTGIEHDFDVADIHVNNANQIRSFTMEAERSISIFSSGSVYDSFKKENFQKYVKARKKGIVTPIIYPAVCIYKPKLEIKQDFKLYLDMMKQSYIDNHDPQDPYFFKHTSDNRIQPHRFEEWARYYKVFILHELQPKNRKIAEIIFPGQNIEIAETKITKDIQKAENLIKNAWVGEFPGKYL